MLRRILDTNLLINHWCARLKGTHTRDVKVNTARGWANELIALQGNAAILTPIYLEFVCGARSENELKLARAFLGAFKLADDGEILPGDWKEAQRIAERVPTDGLPRQMGDCLIRALCKRLRMEVVTAEKRFPR